MVRQKDFGTCSALISKTKIFQKALKCIRRSPHSSGNNKEDCLQSSLLFPDESISAKHASLNSAKRFVSLGNGCRNQKSCGIARRNQVQRFQCVFGRQQGKYLVAPCMLKKLRNLTWSKSRYGIVRVSSTRKPAHTRSGQKSTWRMEGRIVCQNDILPSTTKYYVEVS